MRNLFLSALMELNADLMLTIFSPWHSDVEKTPTTKEFRALFQTEDQEGIRPTSSEVPCEQIRRKLIEVRWLSFVISY